MDRRREANRMVPIRLLRALRDAQREEVDGPRTRRVVHLIDEAVRSRPSSVAQDRPGS